MYSDHCFQGYAAINQIFRVINEQSQPSFDQNFNFISYFNWTGGNGALAPAVPNGGNGEPKGYTGMVGTHHRPSDDISTFGTLNYFQLFFKLTACLFSVPDTRKRYAEC
jgi:meiotically up-regulated gene 157 (Mug157) protein